MSHDIDDLLELIKMLEERIIQLESFMLQSAKRLVAIEDDWYWEHG